MSTTPGRRPLRTDAGSPIRRASSEETSSSCGPTARSAGASRTGATTMRTPPGLLTVGGSCSNATRISGSSTETGGTTVASILSPRGATLPGDATGRSSSTTRRTTTRRLPWSIPPEGPSGSSPTHRWTPTSSRTGPRTAPRLRSRATGAATTRSGRCAQTGARPRNVSQAPEASDIEPVWSPDGTRIAFASNRVAAHNDFEIVVMGSDGSDQVNLSHSPANDYSPAWSPDGRRIAFSRFGGTTGDIWVMNADGTNQIRLTTNPAMEDEPAWSPDGSKILFMSTRDGMPQIYVMNADGSGLRILVASGEVDAEPSWSPDGTKIVFDRLVRDGIQIVVAGADGLNQRVVGWACVGTSCDDAYPPDPSWQPLR